VLVERGIETGGAETSNREEEGTPTIAANVAGEVTGELFGRTEEEIPGIAVVMPAGDTWGVPVSGRAIRSSTGIRRPAHRIYPIGPTDSVIVPTGIIASLSIAPALHPASYFGAMYAAPL